MDVVHKSVKDKEHPYVMVCKNTLYDKELSLRAKGLLCFVLSKRDDWKFQINGFAKELKESKTAIATTLNELIECGYCIRHRHERNSHGYYAGYDYVFFETLDQRKEWDKKHAT